MKSNIFNTIINLKFQQKFFYNLWEVLLIDLQVSNNFTIWKSHVLKNLTMTIVAPSIVKFWHFTFLTFFWRKIITVFLQFESNFNRFLHKFDSNKKPSIWNRLPEYFHFHFLATSQLIWAYYLVWASVVKE